MALNSSEHQWRCEFNKMIRVIRPEKPLHRAAAMLMVAGLFCVTFRGAEVRDIWISDRGDGKAGKGTISDPFNGHEQHSLDQRLQSIPPRTTIHFTAGEFITSGFQVKEGWRISGAAKNATILKLTNNALNENTPGHERCVVYEFDFQGFLQYFELKDLTIDCNRSNQPAYTKNLKGYSLDAWIVAAKRASISNVRALGTWANPGEGFPCRVYHDGTRNGDDRIEISGCENINPVGYLTAICAFDQQGGTFSGFIRNCLVTDHAEGAAFGAGGWRNFDVCNNVTRNVQIPIVIDTHDYYDVGIFGNQFYNCRKWAILMNGGGIYENIKIHDNVFDIAPGAMPPFVWTDKAKLTVELAHNVFIQTDKSLPFFREGPNTKASVHDNLVRAK